MCTQSLRDIGIAPDRELLVGGAGATAVRSVLVGTAFPLGYHDSVAPLLAVAAARFPRVATASLVVGSGACVSLRDMLGLHATPATKLAATTRTHREAEEVTPLRGNSLESASRTRACR